MSQGVRSGFAGGRRQRTRKRVLELLERERFQQVGERSQLTRLRAWGSDARADDRQPRRTVPQLLRDGETAEALGLEDDGVDAVERGGDLRERLVAEAACNAADELTDLRLRLENKDPSHCCPACRCQVDKRVVSRMKAV